VSLRSLYHIFIPFDDFHLKTSKTNTKAKMEGAGKGVEQHS